MSTAEREAWAESQRIAASGTAALAASEPEPQIDIEHRFAISDGMGTPIAHVEVYHRHGAIWLTNVWTHPDHRRKGHARRLIIAALRMFRSSVVHLNVQGYTNRPLSDEALIRFYESFGFACIPGAPGMMRREPAK